MLGSPCHTREDAMLTRRNLFRAAAALGLSTILPDQAAGTDSSCHASHPIQSHQEDRLAETPLDDTANFLADLLAIEAWEDLQDDLDCIELASRYTSLREYETKGYLGDVRTGSCPFCHSKNDTFEVTKDYYCCHGCCGGDNGTTIEFYARLEGLAPINAMRRLKALLDEGTLVGHRPHHEDLWKIMADASHFYHHVLCETPEGAPGRQWLDAYGITRETIHRFYLGFASSSENSERQLIDHLISRGHSWKSLETSGLCFWVKQTQRFACDLHWDTILIPIRDASSHCWGLLHEGITGGGLALQPGTLRGMHRASPYRRGRLVYPIPAWPQDFRRYPSVILAQSPWDVVALHQAGIYNAVHAGASFLVNAGRLHKTILALASRVLLPIHSSDIGGMLFDSIATEQGACLDRLDFLLLPDGKSLTDLLRTESPDAVQVRLSRSVKPRDLLAI